MNEQLLLSLVLVLMAGFFQGTFGLGMKKFAPLAWEAYWLIFAVVGMVTIPFIWASIVIPDLTGAISAVPKDKMMWSMVFGACWGVGAILFGLSITYIGVSLAYGITMALAAAIGSLIPLIQNFTPHPSVPWIIGGIAVMVAGVAVITKAGIMRDRAQGEEGMAIDGIQRGKLFYLGVIFSILNGLFAALLNVGFVRAFDAKDAAIEQGALPRNASLAAWCVVLIGGCVINVLYAIYLLIKNKSFKTYKTAGASKGVIWALITAVLWFAALGTYGQGAAIMGELGPVIAWTMFLALALVISSFWGLKTGEWKGMTQPLNVLLIGDLVLIVSWCLLGYANYLNMTQ